MTHFESITVTAQATFGRDGAMFEGLLGFVAQLSLVLWSLVVVTAVLRSVAMRIYQRRAVQMVVGETDPAGPVADVQSARRQGRATRSRRAETGPTGYVPAFVNSTEA